MELTTRARVRAATLGFVVLVHGWLAMPLPMRLAESKLKDPTVAEEVERWRGVLSALGVERTTAEVGKLAVDGSNRIADFKQATVRPVHPFLKSTQTGQGWALFAAPDTHPGRLEIHARVGGKWEIVYRRLDPERDVLADQLGFRRIRGVYEGGSKAYDHLAHWAAAQIFEQRPEVEAVRMLIMQTHSTLPGAPRDTKTRQKKTVVVERER